MSRKKLVLLAAMVAMACELAQSADAQPGINGFAGLSASQGSTRTFSSGAASLTMMDGVPGSIAAVTQVPFVIGFTPVVGGLGGGIGGGGVGGIGGFGPGGQLGPAAWQMV